MRGKKGIGIKKLSKSYPFSSRTIRRYLKKKPWGKYRVAIKKPGLSPKNIFDRKKFYKKALNFGINNILNKVAFSDEMPARLNGTINKQNTGVRDILNLKNRPVEYFFKNKSISLHIWGGFILYQE